MSIQGSYQYDASYCRRIIYLDCHAAGGIWHWNVYCQGINNVINWLIFIASNVATMEYKFQDNSNNKVILGISINGIMVAYPNTQTTQFYRLFYLLLYIYNFRCVLKIILLYIKINKFILYRWKDISNVINQKKTFRIEYKLEEAKQFIFTESRDAKYIWRLCIAQHLFYIQYQERRPQERSSGCCVRKLTLI